LLEIKFKGELLQSHPKSRIKRVSVVRYALPKVAADHLEIPLDRFQFLPPNPMDSHRKAFSLTPGFSPDGRG
jgi:hypothetical protein